MRVGAYRYACTSQEVREVVGEVVAVVMEQRVGLRCINLAHVPQVLISDVSGNLCIPEHSAQQSKCLQVLCRSGILCLKQLCTLIVTYPRSIFCKGCPKGVDPGLL